MASGSLSNSVVMDGYPDMANQTLAKIRLLGAGRINSVTVNGVAHSEFVTTISGEVIVTGLTLAANSEFTIVFA